MHGELALSASTLLAFIFVLTRMLGAFVFVPFPERESGGSAPRIFLAIATTLALLPRWPEISSDRITVGAFFLILLSEMALGTGIGLLVSFISEAMTVGAQILSLQAGYAYASTVDPTSQADSDVLPVIAQLMAGLLFFTTGLHRLVIQAFADSLERFPPGLFAIHQDLANAVIRVSGGMFSIGLRLAFPVLGLLLMSELLLGLMGRINSRIHLGQQAAPIKMMISLVTLTTILTVVPRLYTAYSSEVFRLIHHEFGH
jgi:flagellar biosynthetic protein FliR